MPAGVASVLPGASPSVSRPERPLTGRLIDRLFEPVEIGLLVYFRIAFGAVMAWEALRYLSRGWVRSEFIEPPLHFTYYGFSWVRPWPGEGMIWHFVALGVLAAMIAAGLFYRAAAVLFFLAFTYVFLLDQANYLNHFYLISLLAFLLIFLPAQRAGSLDVLRKPSLRSATAPAWTLWLLRFQIAVPYVFGGIAKMNGDWLRGEPIRMWLADYFGRPVAEPVVYGFAWGGMLFDLLIVPALLWRRTRVPAFVAAAVFHLTNNEIFHIGIFPWLMLAASVVFLPPEWFALDTPHAGKKSKAKPPQSGEVSSPPPRGRRRLVLGLLGAWVVLQCAVPLRHLLYPGNVSWTEEGHRFAWHMKLRNKETAALTVTVSTASGRVYRWRLEYEPAAGHYEAALRFDPTHTDARASASFDDPAKGMLTGSQVRGAAAKPDMLRQLAHMLAGRMRAAGETPTGAFADAQVSLNGRDPQPLVDPDVNLLQVPRNLRHADWILPLMEPLPARSAGVSF
jgi:hypothetical protein